MTFKLCLFLKRSSGGTSKNTIGYYTVSSTASSNIQYNKIGKQEARQRMIHSKRLYKTFYSTKYNNNNKGKWMLKHSNAPWRCWVLFVNTVTHLAQRGGKCISCSLGGINALCWWQFDAWSYFNCCSKQVWSIHNFCFTINSDIPIYNRFL